MVNRYTRAEALHHRRSPARSWLIAQGALLLAAAVLGLFAGAAQVLHGLRLHVEDGEMALHWLLGAASLAVGLAVHRPRRAMHWAIAFGALYVVTAVFGWLQPDIGAWHVGLGDNLLHLALGLVSFLVAYLTDRRDDDRQHYLRQRYAV